MQIGNLNKIINLFIVGFLVNAIIVLFNLYLFPRVDSRLILFLQNFNSEAGIVLLLLISIPVALFWGVLVEALTELLRWELMHSFRPNLAQKLAIVLRIYSSLESYRYFKRLMTRALQLSSIYNEEFNETAKSEQEDKEEITITLERFWTNIAAALLFHHGSKEQIEYAIQHYSIYLLATNFATILIAVTLAWAFLIGPVTLKLLGVCVFLIVFYLLIRYATDKFYFAYMHIYRFAFLFAREKLNENKK